jgi:hypothetical protein
MGRYQSHRTSIAVAFAAITSEFTANITTASLPQAEIAPIKTEQRNTLSRSVSILKKNRQHRDFRILDRPARGIARGWSRDAPAAKQGC